MSSWRRFCGGRNSYSGVRLRDGSFSEEEEAEEGEEEEEKEEEEEE